MSLYISLGSETQAGVGLMPTTCLLLQHSWQLCHSFISRMEKDNVSQQELTNELSVIME